MTRTRLLRIHSCGDKEIAFASRLVGESVVAVAIELLVLAHDVARGFHERTEGLGDGGCGNGFWHGY